VPDANDWGTPGDVGAANTTFHDGHANTHKGEDPPVF
jgi:hypothetical protein